MTYKSTYNDLLLLAESDGVEVIENCSIGRFKGLYFDNIITLSERLDTDSEKKCILCEELGHHYTSYGEMLYQDETNNRQQERKARAWAFKKLVPYQSFIDAYNAGIKNRYEFAEFLEVTEKFLINAIKYYKEKHGICYEYNDYIIYFEPLGVLRRFT